MESDPAETEKEQSPTFEESSGNAETTQLDEPETSAEVRNVINTDPVLEESFCQVSPKSNTVDKADDGGRSWRWLFNS